MNPEADILIVDDAVANLKVLSTILQNENYKIRPATSGQLAIDAINNSTPDLIILDIRMPGMDGFEVCKIIRGNTVTSAIPIIFISGLGRMSDKEQAFISGGQDYIVKPFQAIEIVTKVKTQLKLKKLQDIIDQQECQSMSEAYTQDDRVTKWINV